MNLQPIQLEGDWVRLVPLAQSHAEALLAAAREESIWQYLMVPQPQSVQEMREWIGTALELQEQGGQLPFAVSSRVDGRVVGTTRYLDIRMADRAVEIGWTWYASEVQRTAVNAECKLLLLRHAFEELGMERVQLKTDALNERSRRAIERIGGQFEGILRQYQRYWHGRQRDTAIYSILRSEWPGVRTNLEAKLSAKI